jgi:hypothetical protein
MFAVALYPQTGFRKMVFLLMLGFVSLPLQATFAGGPEPKLEKSQPGYYRFKLGKVSVIALSDGTVAIEAIKELSKPAEAAQLLAKNYVKMPVDVSVNAFLIQLDKRAIQSTLVPVNSSVRH